jgi:polyketide synthase 12/epothilone polyketide synthase D
VVQPRGTLENLTWQPTPRRPPQAGEVEIRVQATGLNFRDVLNALDLYPGDPGPLGLECAGEVVAISPGVEGLAIGDPVVAIAPASFSHYVTVNAQLVALRPPHLSPTAAATIPTAWLTAAYTLLEVAQMQTGDRVLIHAAAGGVGLAAVQLAHQVGAEVWATASTGKWAALQALGVAQVMNSRTLDFAEQIRERTEGQGVHIVLNCLAGEFIPKSLGVLAQGGRFIEIGKQGIWSAQQVAQLRPDVIYEVVDLNQITQDHPEQIQALLSELIQKVQKGQLRPLPHEVFAGEEAITAFRTLQQAKQVGKIVITPPPERRLSSSHPTRASTQINGHSTYLITGGLGALGLQLATWMVSQGARHVVLVSRHPATDQVQPVLSKLQQTGAKILTRQADVTDADQLDWVLAEIARSLPPLRGIVHAAGVVDDGVLQNQTWERFAHVIAPKVQGAWTLHQATQAIPLDFFVLFSSAASLLGSTGQANYAAANAFLDALAHHRQALGLPGLSINWGPWAESGMAAALSATHQAKLTQQGWTALTADQAWPLLLSFLPQSIAQVGVLPLNGSRWQQQHPTTVASPFFAALSTGLPASEPPATLQPPHDLLRCSPHDRQTRIKTEVQAQVAKVLGVRDVNTLDHQLGFASLGIDSLSAVELRHRLQTRLGCPLPATVMFDYPTINQLTDYLATQVLTSASPEITSRGEITSPSEEQLRVSSVTPGSESHPQRNSPNPIPPRETTAIAIIGLGCRFPGGADSPAAFWQLLRDGVDAITEVPRDRWDIDSYYDPAPNTSGKICTRYGGFVPHLQDFDAQFFRIAPREAMGLDPQQRLLLEVSWETLEHAGLNPDQLLGSPTGVFVGICGTDYWHRLLRRHARDIDAYLTTGNTHSMASGRLSYTLGLTGPSLSVDTACSSALVAVHLAVTSLRNQECDLAIAGGVNRILLPEVSINFSQAQMLSPDGRCKSFDAAASGFVRAEGCGMIALKRLEDAEACGDPILAVILGSAINQDGRSSGLTVPHGPSQQAVIRQALKNSGLQPAQVSYIEAHGTGTALGDPIEAHALGAVFGPDRPPTQPLYLGSAKTNIGHLEAAAGISGLIKTVLALQHQQIPANLHFEQPHPDIPWQDLPLKVPTQTIPWPQSSQPRIAGVSSFGFSGTNAHVVVGEYGIRGQSCGRPKGSQFAVSPGDDLVVSGSDNLRVKSSQENPQSFEGCSLQMLMLSAKTKGALLQLVERYAKYLAQQPGLELADVCWTANTGRSQLKHRLAILAYSLADLQHQLATHSLAQTSSTWIYGKIQSSDPPRHLPTLPPDRVDWEQFLHNLAQLYVSGVSVDWSSVDQTQSRRKVVLPTYPFQRQRYWIDNQIS